MQVRDGRAAAVPPSLEREGLELVSWPSRIARERLDELVARKPLLTMRPIEFDYWAETIPVIRARTGARDVVAAACVDGAVQPEGEPGRDDDAGGMGAPRLRRATRPRCSCARPSNTASARSRPSAGTCCTRPGACSPIRRRTSRSPICDWRTVAPADIVPLVYHVGTDGSDVTYRSQGSRYSDRHEWWYFPDLTVDDLLLFVGFDSSRAGLPQPPCTCRSRIRRCTIPCRARASRAVSSACSTSRSQGRRTRRSRPGCARPESRACPGRCRAPARSRARRSTVRARSRSLTPNTVDRIPSPCSRRCCCSGPSPSGATSSSTAPPTRSPHRGRADCRAAHLVEHLVFEDGLEVGEGARQVGHRHRVAAKAR